MKNRSSRDKSVILIFILLCIAIYSLLIKECRSTNSLESINIETTPELNIEVKNEVKIVEKLLSKTPSGQIKERDNLIAMLDPKDSKSLFKIINKIQDDKNLRLNCHDIAHDLGHTAYQMYGFSGSMNFKNGSSLSSASVQDICAGGFVHGLLEEAAETLPDFAKDFDKICDQVPSKEKDSCYHGVGHALMFLYKRNTKLSVEACKISNENRYFGRCFEGVWMELFWGGANNPEQNILTLGWDKNNPLQPCIEAESIAKPACFIYSAFGYLRFNKRDYAGLVKLCTQSKLRADDSGFCLKGLGIAISHNYTTFNIKDAQKIIVNKSKIEKEFFYAGLFGYANLSGISKYDLQNICQTFDNKEDLKICESVTRDL